MPLRLSSEPESPQRGAGAGGGGRGGWLQHSRAPGWGPMQQPLCLVRRAGTSMALSLREITQRLRGPAGRRGGHPHPKWKRSRDKHLLGETSWTGQLQAGKGDEEPEGCSLRTMVMLAPPVLSPCQHPSAVFSYSAQRAVSANGAQGAPAAGRAAVPEPDPQAWGEVLG